MPSALVVVRLAKGERYYPFTNEAVIGRGSAADIRVPDPTVSRRHASLRLEGTTAVLADLSSSNGTTLNGRRVVEPTRAEDGDTIQVGAIELELRIEEDGPAEPDPTGTPTQIITAGRD